MNIPTCPYCRESMAQGFLVDRGDGNAASQSEWIEGAPNRRWWGISLKGKQRIKTLTFRCPRCGLLQSYART